MNMFWLGILVFSILLEFLTPSALISVWFIIGGAVALLCSICGFPEVIQIIAFFAISLSSGFFLRPIAVKYFRGRLTPTNYDRFIGEIAIVSEEIIEDNWGEVLINRVPWTAVSLDKECIRKGQRVKIIAGEGAKLIVQRNIKINENIEEEDK